MKILPEIKNRESFSLFTDKKITSEQIEELSEAARWAPSCFNNQPWTFVFVAKESENRKEVEEALSLGNGWAKEAPLLVVVGSGLEEDCKSHGIPYYAYDTGMAVMNMTLQAEHMGLKSRQMAGWGSEKMHNAVKFPKNIQPLIVIAIGYGRESKNLKEKLTNAMKEKIIKARSRKPIKKNFFVSHFGDKGKV